MSLTNPKASLATTAFEIGHCLLLLLFHFASKFGSGSTTTAALVALVVRVRTPSDEGASGFGFIIVGTYEPRLYIIQKAGIAVYRSFQHYRGLLERTRIPPRRATARKKLERLEGLMRETIAA